MLGKRPRQMRRTVSISMLGSGSSLSEIPTPPQYPRDKQKPHLDVPACYTPRQVIVSDNMYASELGKAQRESAACYAAPVPISHSGSITRERKETEVVGLSIVAALHTDQKNESKDYKERTVPALVCRNKPVYQLNFLPSAQPSLSCQIPRKQMQPQDVQMQEPSSSHRNPSSSSQSDPTYISSPDVHFLEACCYCTCRLSQGRDIYMYRGDKAFCSEQCRDRQILIDERKDKCVLAALRMRLAVQSVDTRRQHHQALVTSTAAG